MTDLIAIDIRIEPDHHALERAGAENARLRAQYPDGFALDALHRPHITLLQRYVRSVALEGVLAAIVVTPGPEVLDLQSALIEAIAPLGGAGGTAAAFVTTPDEPEINADTLDYVGRYVPDHSSANFVAHMTIGLAPLTFLKGIEKQPFDTFDFHPAGIAIYQLGNNGTARMELKSWTASLRSGQGSRIFHARPMQNIRLGNPGVTPELTCS